MMMLKVLGSSSAGNGYILDNGGEALLLECGVDFKRALRSIDYQVSRLVGALVSHEHGDHCKHIKRVLEARIPCYMSGGTAQALGLADHPMVHRAQPLERYTLGGFTVRPFLVQHDSVEPLGFLIDHPEMGTTLFATDTYYLKYKFRKLSHILLECNYRIDILEENVASGIVSLTQRDRTLRSHMEYSTCRDTLLSNDLSQVHNIVLIHLSSANSDADAFRQEIANETCLDVHIARPGMEIPFGRTPF